jgi:hypothetical protein
MRIESVVGRRESHGKLVIEEELEVSVWRLSVRLENLVTVWLL